MLGNKTLLRYFRKINNTTINENTNLLEYQLNDFKVPCLPLSTILIAFNISHTQNTKGNSGSEKIILELVISTRFVITYLYAHMMKIIFITHNFLN